MKKTVLLCDFHRDAPALAIEHLTIKGLHKRMAEIDLCNLCIGRFRDAVASLNGAASNGHGPRRRPSPEERLRQARRHPRATWTGVARFVLDAKSPVTSDWVAKHFKLTPQAALQHLLKGVVRKVLKRAATGKYIATTDARSILSAAEEKAASA